MRLVHSILSALFPPSPEPIAEIISNRTATARGRVVPRDLITSPLTGETCVYYHYAIEEWRASRVVGLSDGTWHLVERDEAIAEFYLHDRTGRAVIAPMSVQISRGRDVHPDPVPLGINNRRAQQLLIRAGDDVEVTGTAEQVDDLYDEARDYRAEACRVMLRAPRRPGAVLQIRIVARRRSE